MFFKTFKKSNHLRLVILANSMLTILSKNYKISKRNANDVMCMLNPGQTHSMYEAQRTHPYIAAVGTGG